MAGRVEWGVGKRIGGRLKKGREGNWEKRRWRKWKKERGCVAETKEGGREN